MKFLIKIIRIIMILLSWYNWILYMIISSDVPPMITVRETTTFANMYILIISLAIVEFIIFKINKSRCGFVVLLTELSVLILWVISYTGVNFKLMENNINHSLKFIILGGVLTNGLHLLIHLLNLVFYKFNKK